MSVVPPLSGSQGVSPFSPPDSGYDALTIGGVKFLDEEHPSDLEFSFNRALAVHQLIGGSRTTQDLGPNPEDVTWSGQLFAGNVQARVAQLNALYVSGKQVPLSYLNESYSVVIKNFKRKFYHRYWAAYSITILIVADTSGKFTSVAPVSLDSQVNGLSQAAQNELNKLETIDANNVAAMVAACNAMFVALESAGVLSQLVGPQLQGVLNTVQDAYLAVSNYRATMPANGKSAQFTSATTLSSYITLISRNLQQGQAPQTIVTQGGDLFRVAARVYGDPSYAIQIAQTNGLIAPLVSSQQPSQINLPPFVTAISGQGPGRSQ